MGLLERLNLFKRIGNLEREEQELLNSLDVLTDKINMLDSQEKELESAVEHILQFVDARQKALNELNRKIQTVEMSQQGLLDILPDLDVM